MQTLIWLTNEIPFVMAPAALIAAMLGILIVTSVVRLTQQASKVMMVGVMIALTVGVVIIQAVQ
jgi:low affinity Fe/Cu permease